MMNYRKLIMRKFLLAAVLVVVTLVITDSVPAQVIQWRMQTSWPRGHWCHEAFATDKLGMVEQVKALSGGRINIAPFGAGELCPVTEMIGAVSGGVLEAAVSVPAYEATKIPAANLGFGLPYVFNTARDVMAYTIFPEGKGAIEILRKEYAKHNVYIVGMMGSAPAALFSKKPVRTLADFKGLKVRAVGLGGLVLKELGAATVYVPAAEIYTALQRGVIDAASWGDIASCIGIKLYEVAPYLLWPPISFQSTEEVLVNMEKYKALRDDLKHVITAAAYISLTNFMYLRMYKTPVDATEMVRAGKIKEVITLPDADVERLKKLAMDVIAERGKADDASASMYKLLLSHLNAIGELPKW